MLPARDQREVEAATVAELLTALGLHRDAYLVVRDNEVLTGDTPLGEDDLVEVYPVISGGRGVAA